MRGKNNNYLIALFFMHWQRVSLLKKKFSTVVARFFVFNFCLNFSDEAIVFYLFTIGLISLYVLLFSQWFVVVSFSHLQKHQLFLLDTSRWSVISRSNKQTLGLSVKFLFSKLTNRTIFILHKLVREMVDSNCEFKPFAISSLRLWT